MLLFLVLTVVVLGVGYFLLNQRDNRYLLTYSAFNIRASANTDAEILTEASPGQIFELRGEKLGASTIYGSTWYEIRLEDGSEAYIVKSPGQQQELTEDEYQRLEAMQLGQIQPIHLGAFQDTLELFPESYRDYLIVLHILYPEWTFEPFYHVDSWGKALEAELNPENKNLVQYIPGNEYLARYEWMVKNDTVYDGNSWRPANEQAVSYYMDPRNFLSPQSIFQFLDLSSEAETSSDGVEAIFSDNSVLSHYADMVMVAAEENSYRPEALASRIYQEVIDGDDISYLAQGLIDPDVAPLIENSASPGFLSAEEQLEQLDALKAQGNSFNAEVQAIYEDLQAGGPGFEEAQIRYYNYFNIGAYPDTSIVSGALFNGAKYARGDFIDDQELASELLLPWTSPELAILGGAKFLRSEYLDYGQNTLYLQKFDLVSGTYNHQYMQNLTGAYSEGVRLYNTYQASGQNWEDLNFIIPVFSEMPEFTLGGN